MSFGFGIGDFITILQLANNVRKRFVAAPDQFRAISDDIKALSNVLRDIEDTEPGWRLKPTQKERLNEISNECRTALQELQDILDRYQELELHQEGLTALPRRVWKRIKWDAAEIEGFRGRLRRHVDTFEFFLAGLTTDTVITTQTEVARLAKRQDEEERREVLDWLTPANYGRKQSESLGRRTAGTGQWILDTTGFKQWVVKMRQILLLQGIPGSGKTILSSVIINHLERKYQNDRSIGVAYLYCDFQRQLEQTPIDLLSNLVKQLLRGRSPLPGSVKTLYDQHRQDSRPTLDEVFTLLQSVASLYARIFIVVDAIDECSDAQGHRRGFIGLLLNLRNRTNVSILVTSRPDKEIAEQFKDCIFQTVRASDEDVQTYLNSNIAKLQPFVVKKAGLQLEIKTAITKAVDGMFLLAELYLNSLLDKRTATAIRNSLKKLPSGSEAYDYAYNATLERIKAQGAYSYDLALQTLSWVTCAKRPLTIVELQHALAVDIDSSTVDMDNIVDLESITSVCAGLITLEEGIAVRPAHYTVQEFLERNRNSSFPDAEEDIARTCLVYLSFEEFNSGFCVTGEEFERRFERYPLYRYAAQYWGDHARNASFDSDPSVLTFLQDDSRRAAAGQAMFAVKRHPYDTSYSQRVPRDIHALHIAAHFGLIHAVTALISSGAGPDVPNTYDWTPLWMAAVAGRDTVVALLLGTNNVDCDSRDRKDGRSPLSVAAEKGYASVVEMLLKQSSVDPNSVDKQRGRTPLAWAAVNGWEGVVKQLLLEQRTLPNIKDKDGRTPLWLAARNGHKIVVELLLKSDGVDAGATDTVYGQTPLSTAAAKGQEDVVRLLITATGVDLDLKDNDNQTPLSLAAEEGHDGVVQLILATGNVNPNVTDSNGRTSLSKAAGNGHEVAARLLVNAGAQLDISDRYGWTAFVWASVNGHSSIAQYLQSMNPLLEGDDRNQLPNRENTDQRIGDIVPPPGNGWASHDFAHYHILVLCALPLEMAAVRGMLDTIDIDLTKHHTDKYIYSLGTMDEHKMVIVCPDSGPGESPSLTMIAKRVPTTFSSVRIALWVGIGGGVPGEYDDIRLGDVVVGSRGHGVLESQLDCAEDLRVYRPPVAVLSAMSSLQSSTVVFGSSMTAFLSEMRTKHPSMSASFTSCRDLPDRLFLSAYEHSGPKGNCEGCDVTQLRPRPRRVDDDDIPVHYGVILSSTEAITWGLVRDEVSKRFNALCFETGAAGWMDEIPSLVIRGISDYSDSHSNSEWNEYAAAVAAAYMKELLQMVSKPRLLHIPVASMAMGTRATGA